MVTIVLTITTKAQIPNSGFENWDDMGTYMDPEGWWTTNSYSIGSFHPVTRSTDHFPNAVGNYSIRIENNPSLLPSYQSLGVSWVGDHEFPDPAFPITGHPTSLTGYYKFQPDNGDTMYINVLFFNSGNVYAQGRLESTETVADWTPFNIPMSAYSDVDSAQITLSSYYADGPFNVPHGNSVLYIDNLNFDNLLTSVNEPNYDKQNVVLYPVPLKNELNISLKNNGNTHIQIYNLTGKALKELTFDQDIISMDFSYLPVGLYLYRINDKHGNLIDSGKFVKE